MQPPVSVMPRPATGERTPRSFDIVVVGAGMAGLAVAAELGRRGIPGVGVLDAGAYEDARHVVRARPDAGRLWANPDLDPTFWRPWRARGIEYAGMSGLRRRVGGRSLYWGGVLLPIDGWAMTSDWPAGVQTDLNTRWRSGQSLYELEHRDVQRWAVSAGAAPGGPPVGAPASRLAGRSFTPTPLAVRHFPGRSIDVFSPLAWWAPEHVGELREVPRLVPDCKVLSLRTDSASAVQGVLVAGAQGPVTVDARVVVLAAGTVQNTDLLLRTPRARSAVQRESSLGGLVDKIAGGFRVLLPSGSVPSKLLGTLMHETGDAEFRSTHFVSLSRATAGDVLDTWLIGEQRRDTANKVTASPGQPGRSPVVGARLTEPDLLLRSRQRERLDRFWRDFAADVNLPASALEFPTEMHGQSDVAARLDALEPTPVVYELPLGAEQHEAGTLPLGQQLGTDGQVLGTPGLFIAGPCSFPRTGAANPSLTTLALGRRLGGFLADMS